MSNILTNNINPRSGNKITIGGVNDTVCIAGTITYEDVTSVDSVGLITARSGIRVIGFGSSVGINSANPTALLDVFEASNSKPSAFFKNIGGSAPATIHIYEDGTSSNHIGLYVGNNDSTTNVLVTRSNNVGIGTSVPERQFHLESSLATTQYQPVARFETSSTGDFGPAAEFTSNRNSNVSTAWIGIDAASAGGSNLVYASDGSHRWLGNDKASERMRIDLDGRLLIGGSSARTSGIGTQANLYVTSPAVTGTASTVYVAKFQGNSSVADSQALISCSAGYPISANDSEGQVHFGARREGSGNQGAFIVKTGTNQLERLRIDSSGKTIMGTTSSTATLGTGLHVKSNTVGSRYNTGALTLTGTGGDNYSLAFSQNGTSTNAGFGFLSVFSAPTEYVRFGYCVGGSSSNVSIWTGYENGNFQVHGGLSKASGSFRIDHPLPEKTETHELVHSFIEGPQADLIYRGQVDLVGGTATVNLDTAARMTEGTFVLLNTNVSCFTSNETDWTAVRGSVSGNILTIEAQDNTSTATVSWMVIGERQDQHMIDTDWTDENGRVITEPLKTE